MDRTVTPPVKAISLPRWGFQEHLVQRGKAAFWVFAALLTLGGLDFAVRQLTLADMDPVGLTLSWVLMAAYIVPVVLVLSRLDLYEREPVSLMIGAFLWGAWVATAFAGPVNGQVSAILHSLLSGGVFFPWTAAITAPLVEETYKYLGLVALFLIASHEFDDLMDGFIYGALIGLGFTVTEDVIYFMEHFGGSVPDVVQGFLVRVVAGGLYGHVLFTGLAGIGFAYFVVHRDDRPLARRLAVAAGMLALAMFAHFVWNSPLTFGEGFASWVIHGAIKGMPFLLLLALAVRLAQRRERRWLAAALDSELAAGIVKTDDVRGLTDPAVDKQLRQQTRTSRGRPAERLLKDLRRQQMNLAMVRTRVDSESHPDLLRQRALVLDLRRQLDEPGSVGAATPIAGTTSGPVASSGPMVPSSPEPAPPAAAWTSDCHVPPEGMTAWPVPDGTSPGAVALAAGLPLRRRSQLGDWSHVEASNGWRGWVDGRRLVFPPDGAQTTT